MLMTGKKSGLQIDQEGRKKSIKKIFKVKKYSDERLNRCIMSDTCISERLQKLKVTGLQLMNYDMLKELQDQGEASRIGIIDGTQTGGDIGSYLGFKSKNGGIILTDYEPSGGKGRELSSSKTLIKRMKEQLGESRVDLLLFDMLYLNEGMYSLVEEGYVKNILIKYTPDLKEDGTPKLRRNILKRFEYYLALKEKPKKSKSELMKIESCGYNYKEGYDKERGVTYSIYSITNLDTDGHYKISKIIEKDGKTNKINLFYVLTTDKQMSGNRMRELGHNRWLIENNGFKMLNDLVWSKHKWYKDKSLVEKLILLWMMPFNILWLLKQKNEELIKMIYPGMKITAKFVSNLLNPGSKENFIFVGI
jgi:hypothetical protein